MKNAALQALEECQSDKVSFVYYLTHNNLIPAHQIASIAANEFGTPLYDINSHMLSSCPDGTLEKKLILKHQVLPLFTRGTRLFLAQSDPTNHQAISEVSFHTGLSVESVLVEHDKLEARIEEFLNKQDESIGEALGTIDDIHLDDLDIEAVDDDDNTKADVGADGDDAPIVRFVNKLLLDGIKTRLLRYSF